MKPASPLRKKTGSPAPPSPRPGASAFSRRAERPDPELRRNEVPYWWTFDAAAKRYRHRTSGEEIRLIGLADSVDASGPWPWLRFEYGHPDEKAWYPLLVEIKRGEPEPQRGIAQWVDVIKAAPFEYEDRHQFPRSDFVFWRVDHDRSLELWRRETGQPDAYPTYGLWRRADLAVIAAALCLPPAEGMPPADMVLLNGGWLNGQWRSEFYRRSAYSWHRASGAGNYPVLPGGTLKIGHGAQQFYAIAQYQPLPLEAPCPVWAKGETRALWQEPKENDVLRLLPCMMEQSTGEQLYMSNWRSHDPISGKEAWQRDLHYLGYGLLQRDICDFRHRPAEQVLADPININLDFSLCDFVHCVTTPARARYFEFYDVEDAKLLLPDLKVAPHMLQEGATCDPTDILDWREVRNRWFGAYLQSFILHEALMHGLPFSSGFDAGAPYKKQDLGERASFEFRTGETGSCWLYETTMRLRLRLPSDGSGPGWERLFG